MLTHPTESGHARELLKETLKESTDDNEVECILQRSSSKKSPTSFDRPIKPLMASMATSVSRGDPIHEEDPEVIIHEGRLNRKMGPTSKMPTV